MHDLWFLRLRCSKLTLFWSSGLTASWSRSMNVTLLCAFALLLLAQLRCFIFFIFPAPKCALCKTASQSSKSGKKDASVTSLTVQAISVLLDQHCEALVTDFKTYFSAQENKFDQVPLVVEDQGQCLASHLWHSKPAAPQVREPTCVKTTSANG